MEPPVHTAQEPRTLRRASDGRLVAGVCAGLADYFDVDVAVVRIAAAVLVVVGGVGLPLYLAAWLLLPDEQSGESVAEGILADVRSPRGRAQAGVDGERGGGDRGAEAS